MAGNPQPVFAMLAGFGAVAGVAATWFHLPGLLIAWLAVLAGAFMEPAPFFTGPKDRLTGNATPAGPREEKWDRTWRMSADVKWRLVVPNGDWLPGWPPLVAWPLALLAGVVGLILPVDNDVLAQSAGGYMDGLQWANGFAGFTLATAVPAALRRSVSVSYPNPGVRWDAVGQVKAIHAVVGGFVAALVVGWLASKTLVRLAHNLSGADVFLLPDLPIRLVVTFGLASGLLYLLVRSSALAEWSQRRQTQERWDGALRQIAEAAKEPMPVLAEHRVVGSTTVDRFQVQDSSKFLRATTQISTALGPQFFCCVIPAPVRDSQGQPQPGSSHPNEFQVVTWLTEQAPDLMDPAMSPDEAELVALAGLNRAIYNYNPNAGLVSPVAFMPLHVPVSPPPKLEGWARLVPSALRKNPESDESGDVSQAAVWLLKVSGPIPMAHIRNDYGANAQGILNVSIVVSDWPEGDQIHPGANGIYLGATDGYGVVWGDTSVLGGGDPATAIKNIADESHWNRQWDMLGLKSGKPEPHAGTHVSLAYEGRSPREKIAFEALSFTVKQGSDLMEFTRAEQSGRLKTIMPTAQWVSLVGFPQPGARAGERHPLAFTVRWSDAGSQPMPPASPDKVVPPPRSGGRSLPSDSAQRWILAHQVNVAFDNAKLPRPEVTRVECLTSTEARNHIWRIDLRMYGGVTLAKVRSVLGSIRTSMSAPWLQVTPGGDAQTLTLVAGADHREMGVKLAEESSKSYLLDLEWQSVFADAKLVNDAGLPPSLLSASELPANTKVKSFEFRLPSGVTRDRVRANIEKLKGPTGNTFVQVLPSEAGPDRMTILACVDDPMPFPAPINVRLLDDPDRPRYRIPWATGVDGGSVVWDVKENPHLLIAGASGAGKSASQQMLLGAMLWSGWEVFLADPTKGAADFRFADKWLRCMAVTKDDASAMMNYVYDEVRRRRDLNAQYGVGSYLDLPDEVRPAPLAVFLDEFTSLILADKPKKPTSDDPDVQREYQQALADAAMSENIGARAGNIVREARSAGVTLVLGAQRLTAKTLQDVPGGETLRANMARVLLGKATYGEKQSALKDADAAPDLGEIVPKGRGVFETSDLGTVMIQSWYNHPIQEFLHEALDARLPGGVEKVDLSPYLSAQRPDDVQVEGEVLQEFDSAVSAVVPDLPVVELDELDLSDLDLGTELDVEPELDVPREPEPEPEPATVTVLVSDVSSSAVDADVRVWVGDGVAPDGWVSAPDGIFGDPVLDGVSDILDSGQDVGNITIQVLSGVNLPDLESVVAGRAEIVEIPAFNSPTHNDMPDASKLVDF